MPLSRYRGSQAGISVFSDPPAHPQEHYRQENYDDFHEPWWYPKKWGGNYYCHQHSKPRPCTTCNKGGSSSRSRALWIKRVARGGSSELSGDEHICTRKCRGICEEEKIKAGVARRDKAERDGEPLRERQRVQFEKDKRKTKEKFQLLARRWHQARKFDNKGKGVCDSRYLIKLKEQKELKRRNKEIMKKEKRKEKEERRRQKQKDKQEKKKQKQLMKQEKKERAKMKKAPPPSRMTKYELDLEKRSAYTWKSDSMFTRFFKSLSVGSTGDKEHLPANRPRPSRLGRG